ncbi:MAG TPA: hypothetical protein VGA53_04890 [Candidatus Paceibacterota bacterium]
MKNVIIFPDNSQSKLSSQDKKVLQKLIEAAKIISFLYLAQKNPRYPGANFYPADARKKEIEDAAKKNSQILNPYTFIERNKQGELVAVPYSQKFKKELTQVAQLLKEAAGLSDDKVFQRYLVARADDLLQDNFDASNTLWLKTDHSKFGFVIGPFDRYLDQVFFQKRAYMCWVGILDEKATRGMAQFKDLILTSDRLYLPGARRAKIDQVKIRIEDTILFSGLVADFMFVGNNLPSSADLYLIKEHGTMFTLFKPTLKWRFENWLFPTFQQVFDESTQRRFSKEELEKAFLQSSVLHEACHSLMRYEDASGRLQELFPYFDELFTDLLGVKGCGTLILKDSLTEKELEAITLATVCHSLYFYASLSARPHLSPYAVGGAIILEFLRKGKALTKRSKGFYFDSYRALLAINQLTSIIEYYIALGNHKEAEEFLKRFTVLKSFSSFESYLKGIPKGNFTLDK